MMPIPINDSTTITWPCSECGDWANCQPCWLDTQSHRHGMIHTWDDGLKAFCHDCGAREIATQQARSILVHARAA